ncbi:MAG: anti-sigma factor [Gemmatimonadota bacterium]
MDCRAFRQLHGDWVDDVLDPHEADRLTRHLVECAPCARYDTLARRALLVARNAPQIEVSADFSTRLAARIADERRQRIADHAPSHVERSAIFATSRGVWIRRAATVALMAGGTMVARSAMTGGSTFTASMFPGDDTGPRATYDAFEGITSAASASMAGTLNTGLGEIVVVRSLRPVGGALLPRSDDPLLDGADLAIAGDASATTVAATAPLWPTAQMAAHAAHRFAAMEFGDVRPVTVVHTRR